MVSAGLSWRFNLRDSLFDAFSSREPASTSLENAFAQKKSRRKTGGFES
jgi:hypothetical protein